MASQSPAVAAENSGSAEDDYLQGWAALSQMMQAGVSWSGRERNCGFVNLGQGRFVDASYPSGLDFVDDGRAVAVVDWDADGDLDLWLRNRTGPQLRYMRNELRSRPPFVALWLEGRTANRDAVGASVTLRAGGKLQRRDVTTGDG